MILISRSAAQQLFAEVRRWVELGLRETGIALESLMYPLSALVAESKPLTTPLELVSIDAIDQLLIDEIAIPPDEIKAFSPANCHFAGDLTQANAAFNAQIDQLVVARPRLGVHSKLHAHPFARGAFLSGGDMYHGVQAPKAVAWRQRKGLDTAILHVAYPDADPGIATRPWRIDEHGAIARCGRRTVRWRVRSWASCSSGEMRDLGDARIVGAHHRSVRSARRKPYWATRRGARWCDAQKQALREAGYQVSRNMLGRGWRRYLLVAGNRQLLFALPPDFPAAGPRVLEIRRAWCNDFVPVDLPAGFQLDGLRTSLLDLARRYGAPR